MGHSHLAQFRVLGICKGDFSFHPAPLHRVMDKGSAVCLSPPALVSLGFQVQLLVKESYGVRVEALSPELNTS